MPTLSITKTYQDGEILTEADLDNIRESVEGFVNTTGLDSSNIQANGIDASRIGIDDDSFLEFGTGNDGRIGVTSDNLIIQNATADKDITFRVSDNGVQVDALKIVGADGRAQLGAALNANSNKIIGLADADLTVDTDAINVKLLKQFVPVGMMAPYAGTTAPTGWLLCDGSAVSRTTYAALFALMGETAGQGDDSTTFNVPDFRGRFLRGRDAGQGRDPDAAARTAMNTGGATGDAMFSIQDDAFESHAHSIVAYRGIPGGAYGGLNGANSANAGDNYSVDGNNTGGNETRPKNANVTYIIKY